jgi:AmiR/NasT family two-component response regulator
MAVNRADIDALLTLSEEAEQRADATETRAAIGIIMANRRVDERQAFDVLRRASSTSNRKLRLIAEDVVLTGAVEDLPVS